MLHEVFVVLTAIAAVSFLLSGIDDFFIDAYYWIRLLYRKLFLRRTIRPLRQQTLSSIPEKWTAIWIPAWHEHEVIDKMLLHTIESIHYQNYDIFVGTYPNDPLKSMKTIVLGGESRLTVAPQAQSYRDLAVVRRRSASSGSCIAIYNLRHAPGT